MTTIPRSESDRAVRSAVRALPPPATAPTAVPRLLFLLLLVLTALAPPAGAVAPAGVPSPLPGGWVADPAGALPSETVEALNREADRIHAEGRGELAVAVVRSTDDGDPLGFALRLFDHWGIGDAERNDGVLLFLSVEDRAAEIVLGDGVDDPARQAASDRIMQSVMVPRFRRGDLAGGLVAGARAVSAEILGAAAEGAAASGEVYTLPVAPDAADRPPVRRPVPIRADFPAAARSRRGGWNGMLLLPALAMGITIWLVILLSRRGPLAAQGVRGPAPARGPGFFTRLFLSYKECPGCGEWQRTRDRRVIDHATTYSEGLAEVRYACPACGDEEVRQEVIPRDRPPSRSSGGGSSSSSRPSSFGGGRSSGGGSSGRW